LHCGFLLFTLLSSLVIMSIFEASSTPSRGRSFSTWSSQFSARPLLQDISESDPLLVRPGETESDAFIHAGEDILSPPCFNFRPLDLFLQRAHLGDLTNCNPSPRLSTLCLIDDRSNPNPKLRRRSSSSQSESLSSLQFEQQLSPKEGNPIHDSYLPELGGHVYREILNEQELYNRLLEKVSSPFHLHYLVTNCSLTRNRMIMSIGECCTFSCKSK
jgi:hypothetical protein